MLKTYLSVTEPLRSEDADQLIISFIQPHNPVSVDTIRRYIVQVMGLAGLDTDLFKPHSTRAASTSKAKAKNVPITEIMQAAMWKSTSTFA